MFSDAGIDPVWLEALEFAQELSPTSSNLLRVAKKTSEDAARWAFLQCELRLRGRAKFERADEMLFTREALEQATHERVAAYHASRFPEGAEVVDLTTGIGADLIALARRGPVFGFELDPERAAICRWNLRVLGFEAAVKVEDSIEWLQGLAAPPRFVFADPARRREGRRTLVAEDFLPDPQCIREATEGSERVVTKLTPLLADDALQALGPTVQFVSWGRECREALVVAGSNEESKFEAIHVETGAHLGRSLQSPMPGPPAEFLFDADPAAVRVHGLGDFGLDVLGDSIGYLTGPEFVNSPWLKPYRILESGAWDLKRVKRILQKHGSATPTLKQRASGLDLIGLRKSLILNGPNLLSVAIWPEGRSLRFAILADPPKDLGA